MNDKAFYLKKKNKIKIKIFDTIINHLFGATTDLRRRERLRARIALKKIKGWVEGVIEMEEREQQMIVDEARSWLGTKWIHNQALKGVGADCSQFVMAVFQNVGLLPKNFKIIRYNRDWALHNSESKLTAEVKKHGKQIKINEIQAGDVLLYKSGKCASHMAIYLGNDKLIHSKIRAGVVEAYSWENKDDLVSAWRYNG